jgi:hypothetical protein
MANADVIRVGHSPNRWWRAAESKRLIANPTKRMKKIPGALERGSLFIMPTMLARNVAV